MAFSNSDAVPIEVGALLGKDRRATVALRVGGATVLLSVEDARQLVQVIQMAAESAVSDQRLFHYLVTDAGFDEARARQTLRDLRERDRQPQPSPILM